MIGHPISTKLDCSSKNFFKPVFHDRFKQEIYVIYRYGETLTIKYLRNYNNERINKIRIPLESVKSDSDHSVSDNIFIRNIYS